MRPIDWRQRHPIPWPCQNCTLLNGQVAALKTRLNQFEETAAAQKQHAEQAKERLRREIKKEYCLKDERARDIGDTLERLESQLMMARNDAAALRMFNDQQAAGPEAVRALFNDLVAGIDELVFCFFEALSEAETISPVVTDRHALASTSTSIADALWPFLESIMDTEPTMENSAMPAMQYIASSTLFAEFLQPFSPVAADFSGDDRYEGLMRLWCGIAERESQEVVGRWRSIAYRAVRHPQAADDAFLEKKAIGLLASLRDVVITLLPEQVSSSRDWEQLVDSLTPRAVKLLRKAIVFQSATQGSCVLWDYDVMEVDAEVHDDHAMVLEKQPANGSRVLLVTAPGLQAHRKTAQSRETIVVQKAKVVAIHASVS
ncbi:hypothetical protein BKA62DRAFT_728468 [Auriculariales sp. MPI-PUGE-AT-0066]|nr:hypothetical protein BKA62DRAFT_728468 [Auriculariales sp. MPI-PUGE-AT-0066]